MATVKDNVLESTIRTAVDCESLKVCQQLLTYTHYATFMTSVQIIACVSDEINNSFS